MSISARLKWRNVFSTNLVKCFAARRIFAVLNVSGRQTTRIAEAGRGCPRRGSALVMNNGFGKAGVIPAPLTGAQPQVQGWKEGVGSIIPY